MAGRGARFSLPSSERPHGDVGLRCSKRANQFGQAARSRVEDALSLFVGPFQHPMSSIPSYIHPCLYPHADKMREIKRLELPCPTPVGSEITGWSWVSDQFGRNYSVGLRESSTPSL